MTLKKRFAVAVWFLALPIFVLVIAGSALGPVMIPLLMAAVLLAALGVTLPILDQPGFPSTRVAWLYAGELACCAAVVAGMRGQPDNFSRALASIGVIAGAIVPFVLAVVILRAALRTPPSPSGPHNGEL